jgi:hypothetical protein
MDNVLESSAAALYVKVLIDVWRYYNKSQNHDAPGWFWAVATITLGIVFSMLIGLASNETFTNSAIAQVILNGVLASAQAIGVTELQKRG